MRQMLSSCPASISERKIQQHSNKAEGAPVAILNHNVPAAYLIPAETYEWLMDRLEDSELAQIVSERAGEKENAIEVNLDEL